LGLKYADVEKNRLNSKTVCAGGKCTFSKIVVWLRVCFIFREIYVYSMRHRRVILSFLVVLLFVAVFVSFHSGFLVKGLDVGSPRLEGFELGIGGRANVSVSVSNPNFFDLRVEKAVFDVFLDGNRVGQVSRLRDFSLKSGESKRIFLQADLDSSALGAGLLFLNESLEYALRGNVSYSILGLERESSVYSSGNFTLG